MDGSGRPTVLAMRDIREVIVIDGGDTLSLKFEAADCGDTYMLLPVQVARRLIRQLKAAETKALRERHG